MLQVDIFVAHLEFSVRQEDTKSEAEEVKMSGQGHSSPFSSLGLEVKNGI